jgi:hypothetical protein
MTGFDRCHECDRKLEHVTLFCPRCGQPSCSWRCQSHHLERHGEARPAPEWPAAGEAVSVAEPRTGTPIAACFSRWERT